MATATVEKKEVVHRFISKYPTIKVCVEPYIPAGEALKLQVAPNPGKFADFGAYRYATSDKKIVDAIRNSASFKDGSIWEEKENA